MAKRRRRRRTYTKDVKYDLVKREITKADIRNALANQLDERPGKNRWATTVVIVGTAMNGRPLCVVIEEEDRQRIVSAFWA
jgi:hypothetical protein